MTTIAEVEELVLENVKEYDLELARYRTGFVDGLKQRMDDGGSDKCYGFVLGTRQGDPNCGAQTSFTPSRYGSSRSTHGAAHCVRQY